MRVKDKRRFDNLIRKRLLELGCEKQLKMIYKEALKGNPGTSPEDTLVTVVTPKARDLLLELVSKDYTLQVIRAQIILHTYSDRVHTVI